MNSYIVNIVCLTPEYHKLIAPELISLGYSVSAAADNGSISSDIQAISIISYHLKKKNIKDAKEIITDLLGIFKNKKVYFYSCTAFEATASSCWSIGNIECETDPMRVLKLKALW